MMVGESPRSLPRGERCGDMKDELPDAVCVESLLNWKAEKRRGILSESESKPQVFGAGCCCIGREMLRFAGVRGRFATERLRRRRQRKAKTQGAIKRCIHEH